jgi:hypothetical protein
MIWIPIVIGGVIILALATHNGEELDPLNMFSSKLPSEEEPDLSIEELAEIKKQRNALNRKLKRAKKKLNQEETGPESD